MSNILGWLLAVVATILFLMISAEPSIYIDLPTILFIIPFVYGLSFVIHGSKKTLSSISNIKYLFVSLDSINGELSAVYLNQIKLTIITSFIGLSAGLMALLANYENPNAIAPALAVLMPFILYPSLIIGLVYYPLYKKMA